MFSFLSPQNLYLPDYNLLPHRSIPFFSHTWIWIILPLMTHKRVGCKKMYALLAMLGFFWGEKTRKFEFNWNSSHFFDVAMRSFSFLYIYLVSTPWRYWTVEGRTRWEYAPLRYWPRHQHRGVCSWGWNGNGWVAIELKKEWLAENGCG